MEKVKKTKRNIIFQLLVKYYLCNIKYRLVTSFGTLSDKSALDDCTV